jgi:CheY-like chemotaxis protein
MDGFQLASHLKSRSAGAPMILIATTALGDQESQRKSHLAGFHCHLVKPIDFPTLIDVVTRLWNLVKEQGGDLTHGRRGT